MSTSEPVLAKRKLILGSWSTTRWLEHRCGKSQRCLWLGSAWSLADCYISGPWNEESLNINKLNGDKKADHKKLSATEAFKPKHWLYSVWPEPGVSTDRVKVSVRFSWLLTQIVLLTNAAGSGELSGAYPASRKVGNYTDVSLPLNLCFCNGSGTLNHREWTSSHQNTMTWADTWTGTCRFIVGSTVRLCYLFLVRRWWNAVGSPVLNECARCNCNALNHWNVNVIAFTHAERTTGSLLCIKRLHLRQRTTPRCQRLQQQTFRVIPHVSQSIWLFLCFHSVNLHEGADACRNEVRGQNVCETHAKVWFNDDLLMLSLINDTKNKRHGVNI